MKKTQLDIYHSAAAAADKEFASGLKGHAAHVAQLEAFKESGLDTEKDYDLWHQFHGEQMNRCRQLSAKPAPSAVNPAPTPTKAAK